LAVWGAILSTIIAIRQLVSWRQERTLVDVSAGIVQYAVSVDDADDPPDPRLIVVRGNGGLTFGLGLSVGVSNKGTRGVQISSVYFRDAKSEHQVSPSELPAVLEPNTRIDVMLQLEWIASLSSGNRSMGVLDALGRRHAVDTSAFGQIQDRIADLPTRNRKYRRKDGGSVDLAEEVEAFQAFDKATLVTFESGQSENV
jgi:hypothetical protein